MSMMWGSSQSQRQQQQQNRSSGNRSANIRRYLGRDSLLGRDSFASLNDDDDESDGGSLEGEQKRMSALTIEEEDEFGCSSTWQEDFPIKTRPQQEDSFEVVEGEEEQCHIELDTDLDMDHYLLSVYDKSDDASSSIYTGGTASTSFSSSSTSSTRTRHRGAYKNRRRHMSKKSTTAPMSWLESMEHRAYHNRLEWTPKKGWQKKKEEDAWDAAPAGDWSEPNAVFDAVEKKRIEI